MTAADLIAALSLPATARVDQRVPKKLLVENGAPTASDKRQINEGVEALQWIAALKPATIAVGEYRDGVREYVEIAVLSVIMRMGAKESRLIELIHRAVPYPVILVAGGREKVSLSLAHKRWSQGESGATVLDGEIATAGSDEIGDDAIGRAFRAALALDARPGTTLYELYSGWIDAILALHVARVNGVFVLPESAERAVMRRHALAEWSRLEAEMAALRAAASKEKQLARQVELNLELQRLRAAHAAARGRL